MAHQRINSRSWFMQKVQDGIREAARGKVGPARPKEIAVVLQLLSSGHRYLERSELEQELQELERRLEEMQTAIKYGSGARIQELKEN